MKHVALWLFFICLCGVASAQSELQNGYYVVVAAYKNTRGEYARKHAEQLKAKGYEAQYGLNTSRKLFFVYVHYLTDRSESLTEMRHVRQKGEFPDAWVRVIKDSNTSQAVTMAETPRTSHPTEEKKKEMEKPSPESVQPAEVKTSEPVAVKKEDPIPVEQPKKLPDAEPKILVTEKPAEISSKVPETPWILPAENTKIFLNLVYAAKNEIVEGEVQVIDTERGRLIQKAKGNQHFILPDPKSKSDQLTLTADVFGYRKVQHEIKYPLPLADTTLNYISKGDSALVISFELVRYQRGDIQTLYHVYFYNDAVIMLPESKYELSSLLQMMEENQNYRIRLHGHSNGNYSGKILALGPDKNFFSIEGTVQTQGSAKDLSGQRAGTIKEFLVSNGIASDRIEVKAWGGKKPLFDKHSIDAKRNVRVEVEILEQ